jgi:hypothetical protein
VAPVPAAGTVSWHAAPFNLEWELLPGAAPGGRAAAAAAAGKEEQQLNMRRRAAMAASGQTAGGSSSISSKGTGRGLFWSSFEVGRQLDRQMQLPHKTVISLVSWLVGTYTAAPPHHPPGGGVGGKGYLPLQGVLSLAAPSILAAQFVS